MTTSPFSGDDLALTEAGRMLLADKLRALEARVQQLAAAAEEAQHAPEAVVNLRRATADLEDLRNVLASAPTLDDRIDDPGVVLVGDEVLLCLEDGTQERYVIVNAVEAALDDSRISVESPMAEALLGQAVGHEVEVQVGATSYRCRILHASRA